MQHNFLVPLVLAALMVTTGTGAADDSIREAPLRVLLIAGGCCHDYATQSRLLKAGIEERINAVVTVVFNPSTSTDTRFDIYLIRL
jgi:hypothetical protein